MFWLFRTRTNCSKFGLGNFRQRLFNLNLLLHFILRTLFVVYYILKELHVVVGEMFQLQLSLEGTGTAKVPFELSMKLLITV